MEMINNSKQIKKLGRTNIIKMLHLEINASIKIKEKRREGRLTDKKGIIEKMKVGDFLINKI